jgi:hypothetical protein
MAKLGEESGAVMQTEASARVERGPWYMPSIEVGEVVVWSHNAQTEPNAAIVTRVGQKAISVVFFSADSRRPEVRDGVRHVSDPELAKIMNREESGVWWDTRTMTLLREMGRLRKQPDWAD